MVQFKPYYYQKLISSLMDEFNNIVCVKSRQLGLTQIILSKFLHRASLNPAYSGMAFMRNGDDASAISRRARQMLTGLNDYIIPDSDNVGYLKLKALGEIYFKNSSREGSRSYDSVLDFLFDEAAFSENIQQIYAASSPSGALAGDKITKMVISTPSAKSGWYWDKLNENNDGVDIEQLCIDVADGKVYKDIPGLYWFVDKASTVKLIVHWKAHPIYSQIENYLEYRMQQDGTDWETVLREYDLRFIDSTVAVFDSNLVRCGAIGQLEHCRDREAVYYAGIDCSTTGDDYTVCMILKESHDTFSVVALYRKRKETSQYHLYQITELLNKYEPEITAIETTGGVGQVYLEQLSNQCKHLKFESIKTTGDSKPALVSTLQLALEKKTLTYPQNSPIVEELLSFRRQGKKLEAATGKHDDTVLALCFALSVINRNKPFIDVSKIKIKSRWDD
ncbi:Terminase-like family protein [Brasilonema sp. UFV-L1]|uniref:phage terminase large subunit family protein n=1 Tax=Brasilonema sp. UFV-L1 TaxID=2234130 RepID=UPI00145F0D3B|nr:Terminase-like family protein [Brasilonema sp. UFV-L1]